MCLKSPSVSHLSMMEGRLDSKLPDVRAAELISVSVRSREGQLFGWLFSVTEQSSETDGNAVGKRELLQNSVEFGKSLSKCW